MSNIKVAIIGCGDIGRYHATTISGKNPASAGGISKIFKKIKLLDTNEFSGMQNVIISAASDIDEDKLLSFKNDFNIPYITNDYNDVIKRSDVDAILICVPPFLHHEICIKAAENGKHIFCEKPMAMTSQECYDMISQAKKSGVILQIGYVLRYSSERMRIKEAILKNEIGRPIFWREIYNMRAGPSQKWVHDKKLGGGVLFENSHSINFLIDVFGYPISIFAIGGTYKPENTNALDTIGILFNFKDGDKAFFSDSYALKGFGWDKVGCRPKPYLQLDIIGKKGLIQFPDENFNQILTLYNYTSSNELIEKQKWVSEFGANGYKNELELFFNAIRTNNITLDNEDGFLTIKILETVIESLETGEKIECNESTWK